MVSGLGLREKIKEGEKPMMSRHGPSRRTSGTEKTFSLDKIAIAARPGRCRHNAKDVGAGLAKKIF